MQLTEEQLFAYIECPVYYQIRFQRQQIQPKCTWKTLAEQVLQYFFSNLLNGQVKTYKELKNKWDKLCSNSCMTSQDVLKGWGMILKTVDYVQENQLIVGDVACKYRINAGNDSVVGQIHTILIFPDKHIELLYLEYSEKHLDEEQLKHMTKYTLDYFGFKNVYGVVPNYIKIHSIKYNEDCLLTKTVEDWERLQATIHGVSQCLSEKIYYPRETLFCKSCPAHYFCGYWKP